MNASRCAPDASGTEKAETFKRRSLLDELRVRYEAVQDTDRRPRRRRELRGDRCTAARGVSLAGKGDHLSQRPEAPDRTPVRPRLWLRIRFAAVRPRFGRSARAPHPWLSGARTDRRLLRDFGVQAVVHRGGARVGLVCREDPRCVRAAIRLPPRGRCRRDAAQVHLLSPARDPGAGVVSRRPSDGAS